jgi:hypothetical protein
MEAVEVMRLTRKQLRPTGRYLLSAQFSLKALVIAENSWWTLHRASIPKPQLSNKQSTMPTLSAERRISKSPQVDYMCAKPRKTIP